MKMIKSISHSCKSRIGRQPIPLPAGVTCNLQDSNMIISGQKGNVSLKWPDSLDMKIENNIVSVIPNRNDVSPIWGTMVSRLKSIVKGVSEGCSKVVNIKGVGYKAQQSEGKLELFLGKSHTDKIYDLDKDINISVSKDGTKLTITGCDSAIVGNAAAKFRKLRKINPYTTSGISVEGDRIRKKEGKKKK